MRCSAQRSKFLCSVQVLLGRRMALIYIHSFINGGPGHLIAFSAVRGINSTPVVDLRVSAFANQEMMWDSLIGNRVLNWAMLVWGSVKDDPDEGGIGGMKEGRTKVKQGFWRLKVQEQCWEKMFWNMRWWIISLMQKLMCDGIRWLISVRKGWKRYVGVERWKTRCVKMFLMSRRMANKDYLFALEL